MPLTYSTALKTARANAIVTALDDGSGPAFLEITTSGGVVLATITLDDPCGTVSNGVLTLSGFPKTVAVATSGTAALARLKDSTGNSEIGGITVGTSGTDIVLSTASLLINQEISISSFTITVA